MRPLPLPALAHEAQLQMERQARIRRNPSGTYDDVEYQWGYVDSINTGPPPTLNLYLDGTQTLGNTAYLTRNVRYLASYVPNVGDVVIVQRGKFRSSSDRVVLGKLAGSPSPTPLPLCSINASNNQWTVGPNMLWGGAGAPPSTLGQSGDFYLRTDTPSTSDQRLYVNINGTWTGIL